MKSKWVEKAATEEMDSRSAIYFIASAVQETKNVIGDPKKILCVGCSDGTEISQWGHGIGIDLNDASIAKAKARGFDVKKMDMHEMKFADNNFDLVFARDVFEHADSPIQAISEMARVSNKYVVIVLPDDSWASSGWHFLIPTLKQMISLGEKVGLNLRAYREYQLASPGQVRVWEQALYIFEKR